MGRLFDPEGPIAEIMTLIMNLMILSIMWLVCSIPVVTMGTATAALYTVTLKMAKHEEYKVFRSFLAAFKENLWQGILLTLIFALGLVAQAGNFLLILQITGTAGLLFNAAFLLVLLCFLSAMFHAFALQAKFVNPVLTTVKNAFTLAINKPLNSIAVVFLNLVPLIVFLLTPDIFLNLLPGWMMLAPALISLLCARIFSKVFDAILGITDEEAPKNAED